MERGARRTLRLLSFFFLHYIRSIAPATTWDLNLLSKHHRNVEQAEKKIESLRSRSELIDSLKEELKKK